MPSLRRPPHVSLRGVVDSYWQARRDLSADGGFVVTPDAFVDLIFFDRVVRAADGRGEHELPSCVLLGPLDMPLRLTAGGTVKAVGVRLHPWALGRLLRAPADARAWHDAAGLFGPAVVAAMRACAFGDWGTVEETLEPLLRARLLDGTGAAEDSLAREFVSAEAPRVAGVSARRGLSTRHTQRLVKATTHQTPKQLAGLKRFQDARDALWAAPGRCLAALAFESGYADQAHLTREFKRYAGVTPRQFAAEARRAQR